MSATATQSPVQQAFELIEKAFQTGKSPVSSIEMERPDMDELFHIVLNSGAARREAGWRLVAENDYQFSLTKGPSTITFTSKPAAEHGEN